MREFPGRLVLLGHPLGHSFSPKFQNAALAHAGIPLSYELLDVPRSALDDTVATLRRERAAGNVTVPYKEPFRALCDRASETARAVGAVNTFWTAVDGALVGDNTDVDGFRAAARELLGARAPNGPIAVLGAGGAAAAALYAMKGWENARFRMYARTRDRAEQLARRLEVDATFADSAADAVRGAALLVNATPVGLRDDSVPIAPDGLPDGIAVLDIVYRAGETALVRQARARGLRALDGAVMLVEQGALAFERWFGIPADRSVMWAALRSEG
ncbi:MAG: shikimate dehydrogenase [Gemmatimonadaceae bacterium]